MKKIVSFLIASLFIIVGTYATAQIINGSGSIVTGAVVNFSVNFSESNVPTAVTVTGSPTITLNDGGVANYVSGSQSSTLQFTYTVTSGQTTSGNALQITAFNLGASGTIQDIAGNNANTAGAIGALTGIICVNSTSCSSAPPPTTCNLNAGQTPGTQYYVSSSGSDSNPGTSTSTPWQTIAHVNLKSSYHSGSGLAPGDCVSFQATNTFNGCPIFSTATNIGSSSTANPITVNSYGTGANAEIAGNCPGSTSYGSAGAKVAAITIDGGAAALTGFTLENLILRVGTGPIPYGVIISSNGGNASSAITVQGMDISGFQTPAANTTFHAAEIIALADGTGACGALSNINIIGNNLHGSTISSNDEGGVDTLGCGLDITNFNVIGNTVFNMGWLATPTGGSLPEAGQIEFDGVASGTAKYNLVYNNGANANQCGGVAGIETYTASGILIEYNEVYNEAPTTFGSAACDFDGIDLDGSTGGPSIVQYNYTHKNAGAGVLAWMGQPSGTWGGTTAATSNTIRYNISENDSTSQTAQGWGSYTFSGNGAAPGIVNVYNNTIYQGNVSGTNSYAAMAFVGNTQGPTTGSIFANNIMAVTSLNQFVGCNNYSQGWTLNVPTFKANDYWLVNGGSTFAASRCTASYTSLPAWQAAISGGDTGATTASPLFITAPPQGTCETVASTTKGPQPCPADYTLSSATVSPSTLIGAGINLTASPYNLNAGITDYFGLALPVTVTTVGPTIIDPSGNSWAMSNTNCTSTTPCIALNGGANPNPLGIAVAEIALVNGNMWQENTALNWYSMSDVAGVPTTGVGPITTSPVLGYAIGASDPPATSRTGTVVTTQLTPPIVDSAGNAWTITLAGTLQVNGGPTAGSGVTELAYVNAVVWQENSAGNWYSMAFTNGAITQLSGPTGSPFPNTGVALGREGYVVLTSNETTACGATEGPGLPASWSGPGGPAWDAHWDAMTALMGRSPSVVTAYMNDNYTEGSGWIQSATALLTCSGPSPLTKDTRTNPASGTIPLLAWPFGLASGVGNNYFSGIAAGNDDCSIANVLAQFNVAGYHTLYIRPAHEMNGTWYGWSITQATDAEFVAAWEHFYTAAHNYAAGTSAVSCGAGTASNASPLMNLTIAFTPNVNYPVGSLTVAQWAPPPAYIDDYSIDDYGGDTPSSTAGNTTNYLITTAIALAKANGKSISGSEIGGLNATWVQNYVTTLATAGVPILYWDWWDSDTVLEATSGYGSWSWPGSSAYPADTNCNNATGASNSNGDGDGSPCGVNTPPTGPTAGSVAYYWWLGFNWANGTISSTQ